MKAEVKCRRGPGLEDPGHSSPTPTLGKDKEATPSRSIWGDEVEIKAEGPRGGLGRGPQSKPCQSLCSESYSSSAPTHLTPSNSMGVPWCRSARQATSQYVRLDPWSHPLQRDPSPFPPGSSREWGEKHSARR